MTGLECRGWIDKGQADECERGNEEGSVHNFGGAE